MTHHQASQRSVAIREVEYIGIVKIGLRFLIQRRQVHAVQAWQITDAGIAARGRINADGLKIVGGLLEIADRHFAQPHFLAQELAIAVLVQPGYLLFLAQARQVVFFDGVQRNQGLAIGLRQREVVDKIFIRATIEAITRNIIRHHSARIATHYLINAKVLAIKVDATAEIEVRIESGIEGLFHTVQANAQIFQQPHGDRTEVGTWRL